MGGTCEMGSTLRDAPAFPHRNDPGPVGDAGSALHVRRGRNRPEGESARVPGASPRPRPRPHPVWPDRRRGRVARFALTFEVLFPASRVSPSSPQRLESPGATPACRTACGPADLPARFIVVVEPGLCPRSVPDAPPPPPLPPSQAASPPPLARLTHADPEEHRARLARGPVATGIPGLSLPLSVPPAPGAGKPCACPARGEDAACPPHARHPQAALMELPVTTVGEILSRLDLERWTAMRLVSREAREAVDDAADAAGIRAAPLGVAPRSAALARGVARTRGGWRLAVLDWCLGPEDVDVALLVGLDDPDLIAARRDRGDPLAQREALARVSPRDAGPVPVGIRAAVRTRARRCLSFLVADTRDRVWVNAAFRDACAEGWVAGAMVLLERGGAGVEATSPPRRTALHLAARGGHADVVRWLATRGADPEATDSLGRTPMHEAAMGGRSDAVRALLDLGASADVRDGDGKTPLRICNHPRLAEVAALLRSRGGTGRRG